MDTVGEWNQKGQRTTSSSSRRIEKRTTVGERSPEKYKIRRGDIENRVVIRRNITGVKDLSDENQRTAKRVLLEEKPARANQKMKEYLRRRKELQKVEEVV